MESVMEKFIQDTAEAILKAESDFSAGEPDEIYEWYILDCIKRELYTRRITRSIVPRVEYIMDKLQRGRITDVNGLGFTILSYQHKSKDIRTSEDGYPDVLNGFILYNSDTLLKMNSLLVLWNDKPQGHRNLIVFQYDHCFNKTDEIVEKDPMDHTSRHFMFHWEEGVRMSHVSVFERRVVRAMQWIACAYRLLEESNGQQ
jgi:hypothetical protein